MTTNKDLRRHIDWGMVGVLFAIVLQSSAALWWAAQMDRRMTTVEAAISPIQSTTQTVVRLDERTQAIKEAVSRIERRLDVQDTRR